jgi:sn1-specific diacylglycerol lipase
VANLTGSAVDYTLFGGRIGAGAILSNSISSAISFTEKLALLPLELGEGLTSASIVAAHGAINTLAQLFPGSDDASFSLVSFVQLVRKERTQPVMKDHLPEDTEEYGVAETTRALVAWGALQSVTVGWKERQWMKHMREIDVHDVDEDKSEPKRERKESRIRVNSNVVYPGQQGQIITADIEDDHASSGTSGLPGHAKTVHLGAPGPSTGSATSTSTATMKPVPIRQRTRQRPLSQMTDSEVKSTLRRLSKLVLAGYGGASLWFFGVSPIPTKKADEQASLTSAIDASETEAVASSNKRNSLPKAEEVSYAWWNLLMGKHDKEIFDSYANADEEAEQRAEERRQEASQRAQTAVVGDHGAMPRFWVLSDHTRREIVLVIRGKLH